MQSAHMPMIDALMMAYTVEMISIEKVVASVKRFSTFSASKELPFDLEDAMVFWINKVGTHSTDKNTTFKGDLSCKMPFLMSFIHNYVSPVSGNSRSARKKNLLSFPPYPNL